ncbi:MAG: 30S ribosomal protein S12 methylthiotransferase RimO [Bacteroidales bacterium]|nr:30S ribosomal protein S12 methylthiotransferase RimO [Bacteroidales bacterium]
MGKVQLITMGCSKNRVDSEHLLQQMVAAGWSVSPEGENLASAGVDTVLINTCGFIGDAKEESIGMILQAARAKKEGWIRRLFVFGCLSQRYAAELPGLLPEVDGFFGAADHAAILAALGLPLRAELATRRHLTTPSHYAYLKIAEGCDRRCSYCAIPLIRGPHVSVPMEQLEDEARSLASAGVKELIVIAQDTTWYGLDLYGKRMLAPLLERLAAIRGIEWIRLHYSYPDGFPEEVLDLMAAEPKLCKYLDIPLQHIADPVLTAMRRSTTGRETRALLEKIRAKVPGVVLRTTLMVGHPGETEEAFNELLEFVKEARFERLGAFQYSEEEGTWGAAHLKDEIPPELKQERYNRLMEVQSGISAAFNTYRIGTTARVLFDSASDGVLTGRSQWESPEVDGEILVSEASFRNKGLQSSQIIGTFAECKITAAGEYDLLGEPL